MDYNDTPEEARFRSSLRRWLLGHPEYNTVQPDDFKGLLAWYRALAGAGYVGVSLPAEFGGRGLDDEYEGIVNEEIARAGSPPPPPIGHIAHALADFGSTQLKKRFLPGLLSCQEAWCQGFSEPGAGSDLAGITTRAAADRPDGSLLVSGHKIWTSGAMWSKWCLLLARTDLQSERHRGLSMMVIDMEAPGIDRREIVMSNGSREFAEVYLDGVEVPSANVVGRPGDGWAIAMGLLTYERGPADMGWVGRYKRALADASVWLERQLPEIASGNRERLAAAFVELNVMEWHVKRSLARRKIAPPGPESSVDKLLATRVEQGLYRTLLEVWETSGLVDASLFGSYMHSRAQSIYGGTQQIQRNIVAQRVLRMPRS